MSKEVSKTILFTGAGFTHNFGGYLADEMWALIFSHPQVQKESSIKLRQLMLDDFDYESVYTRILLEPTGKLFDQVTKETIKNAVKNAYQMLDDIVRAYKPTQELSNFQKFVGKLKSDNKNRHLFFTINQDLFVERHLVGLSIKYPGIPISLDRANKLIKDKSQPLAEKDFITLPTKENLKKLELTMLESSHNNYIKLHGSFDWKSSMGLNMPVIGLHKEDQINNEPLLLWYRGIFEQALNQGGVKLLIIGYGFRDRYINEIIANAVKNAGLRIYVISPQSPRDFSSQLKEPHEEESSQNVSDTEEIFSGLAGYFQYKLPEIFFGTPSTKKPAWKMIEECLKND